MSNMQKKRSITRSKTLFYASFIVVCLLLFFLILLANYKVTLKPEYKEVTIH
ncbi:hypothetical protein MIDIC_120005 [Alphaproteobacteria bacterium]